MKKVGWLISKYLVWAIVPYFVFSWLLLSVILFVQQASRFSDIFFSVNIPSNLIWQLSFALIPNVIAFTCPMAMLVGTIIGLSKMQEDSEIVAIRAAGVANYQITIPIILLGLLLCVFAFVVNLKGVPLAARLVRNVALQTAIKKLESPIEPGVFNTEIAGYTIYVKGGDIASGRWTNIFIYNEDASNGTVRLITSKRGRIDTTGQFSEMVLEDATVTTIPAKVGTAKYVSENIGDTRIAIKTRRAELIERFTSQQATPEELGLSDLSSFANSSEGPDRIEAQILLQRRIILSVSPLIFCLLGAAMILRFNRGGRGFAMFLALFGLIAYYLLTFLGEQLARTGKISVFVGGAIPIVISAAVIAWFNYSSSVHLPDRLSRWLSDLKKDDPDTDKKSPVSTMFVDVTTGLRDFDLVLNLIRYFLLALGFLTAVFMIFTAFEMWRYAGVIDGGALLLGKYLLFLVPFVYLQIAPSAAMIATIATYVVKSRQNEIVTWTAAGQSVYRLMVPCFLLMLLLGAVDSGIQEWVAPAANRVQDTVRNQIRSGGVQPNPDARMWIANDQRIYSFKMKPSPADGSAPSTISASDNEKRVATTRGRISDVTVYEFGNSDTKLQSVYRADSGVWGDGRIRLEGKVEKNSIVNGKIETETLPGVDLAESEDPFVAMSGKPSHMSISELKTEIASSDSDLERRNFTVALEKRYTAIFLPLVIALFTAPFALSLHRSSRVVTVGYAIGLWLVFTGVTYLFEEFGLNGMLSPRLAVYAPIAIFSMVGVYLLSRVRT